MPTFGSIKELHFRGETVTIVCGKDGFYRDKWGGIYGLADESMSVDPTVRAGIGWFSLPEDHPWSDAADAHDFAYSCPAWQTFHTRKEADSALHKSLERVSTTKIGKTMARIAYWAVRVSGWKWWEGK